VRDRTVQGWFDPFHQPWELVEWCRSEGIVFQAYSPLGTQWTHKGDGTNPVFANKLIKTIADKHGRSPAQVVLKWLLQEGIAVVSRSNQHDHVKEMTELIHFNLPLSDMERLRALANSYKP
jgi:diketogulonate reductase-like aldo/keto reductase